MVKRSSDVTSEILDTGMATVSQLAKMFRTDAKTLPQRLRSLPSSGLRGGYKVYDIRDAASFIVTPGYEIEQYIRQMSAQELPPLMQKEYWNGQRARIAYEKEMGNLWPTEDIIALFAVLENGIRQTTLLVVDDVEREDGVTDGQKKTIRRIMDGAVTTFKDKLTEAFASYYADREDDPVPEPKRGRGRPRRDSGRVPEAPEDEEDYI